ncbi:MAG TPA: hypothetical protein VGI40_23625 [Pirellulaceae bacterium]|jgi:hypothetical protein
MPDEVEQFLRRVAQMRAQAEAQAKGQQPPAAPQKKKPKAQRQQAAKQQSQAPLANRQFPPPLSAMLAEIVDPELAERPDCVARLVNDDLRETQQIGEHTRRLGAEVDASDNKMQSHLHQVFDHQLGRLKSSSVETALVESERSASELSLDQIRRMLLSPGSIRDAIVMAEILKRPEL